MSNALTDIAIPRPSPDAGKAFRLWDYFSDLLGLNDINYLAVLLMNLGGHAACSAAIKGRIGLLIRAQQPDPALGPGHVWPGKGPCDHLGWNK